jgi:hypothetical protein
VGRGAACWCSRWRATTRIWVFWGKSGTNAPACTTNGATWDSTFCGVWHMNQTNALDSTANTNHANLSVATSDAAGKIDRADGFNGSSSYINVVDATTLEPAQITLSAWLKVTGNGSHSDGNCALTKSRSGQPPYCSYLLQHRPNDGKLYFGIGTSTLADSAPVTSNTWVYLAGTYISGSQKLYRDGILRNSSALSGAINYSLSSPQDDNLHFGNWGYTGFGRQWQGAIDEVRIENVVRSSNWIWACWMNMASNGVFTTYGAPTGVWTPTVANSNAVVGTSDVTLNGYLTDTGQDANVSAEARRATGGRMAARQKETARSSHRTPMVRSLPPRTWAAEAASERAAARSS